MPLIKIGKDKFPEWCEIDRIRLLTVEGVKVFDIISPVFAVCVSEGKCLIDNGNVIKSDEQEIHYFEKGNVNLVINSDYCEVVLIEGRWGKDTGSSGFFVLNNSSTPANNGDPVTYSHKTEFDNHYHDFDECWIILKGKGIAVTEGKRYEFEKGDCILTRMGDHHDLPEVIEEVHGIWFETTLKGKKRVGHLWKHTHDIPEEQL